MQTQSNNKQAYHHVDLRRVLVAIAAGQVEREGTERFSVREAAREADVTSGAVYHHFPDKHALLMAVAHQGFVRRDGVWRQNDSRAEAALQRFASLLMQAK